MPVSVAEKLRRQRLLDRLAEVRAACAAGAKCWCVTPVGVTPDGLPVFSVHPECIGLEKR